MKPSKIAKDTVTYWGNGQSLEYSQKRYFELARAYLRLREAAEDVVGDGVLWLNDEGDWSITLDGVDKLVLLESALEEDNE